MRRRRRARGVLTGALLATAAAVLVRVSVAVGEVALPLSEAAAALAGRADPPPC